MIRREKGQKRWKVVFFFFLLKGKLCGFFWRAGGSLIFSLFRAYFKLLMHFDNALNVCLFFFKIIHNAASAPLENCVTLSTGKINVCHAGLKTQDLSLSRL